MNKKRATDKISRQGQTAALVIAGSTLFWLLIQYLGVEMDIPLRWMILADLAALGALLWALIVSFWIWRDRQRNED